jgi:hypothetical protein
MSRKDRVTFDLLMVETGWAATFPIYPSVRSCPDLVLLRKAGKDAFDNKIRVWADPKSPTG